MSHHSEDIINIDHAKTLDGLFRLRVHRSGSTPAYHGFNKESKRWEMLTWEETSLQVERWRARMACEELQRGDRVAVLLRNCSEWIVFEQAALSLGLVVVPLYTDDRPDSIAYILQDADIKLLLVQDLSRLKRLLESIEEESALKRIIVLDDRATDNLDPRVITANDWLAGPASNPPLRELDPHALATIVYTSGTTGRPKGVMLSHHNILSVIHAGLTMVSVYPDDIFLSFLPLSHTLERTGGYYLPMAAGSSVAFARSIPQLAEDLLTVQPTVMIAVPRIFERVHGRISQQLEKGTPIARMLFHTTVKVGYTLFEYQQARRGWHLSFLLWPLLKKVVANKVQAKLGGRLRLAVCGGAAMPFEIAKTFIGLGVTILQGYGLTETSPVISINTPEHNNPASVGVALRGIKVRIGEKSELQVKSPGVMMGYWNNHAATKRMIEADGWLKTGDQARIDDKGFIFITGRIKDILVLSNGEKVPPGDLEMALTIDPLFEQVMVVGEGRSHLSALIVVNAEAWPVFVQHIGLDPMSPDSLESREVKSQVVRRCATLLHDFPGYAKVRRVHLTMEPWTVDNGLLTPTMKTKRNKVLEHYATAIERLYEE